MLWLVPQQTENKETWQLSGKQNANVINCNEYKWKTHLHKKNDILMNMVVNPQIINSRGLQYPKTILCVCVFMYEKKWQRFVSKTVRKKKLIEK